MADLNIDTSDITSVLRKNLEGYTPDLEVTHCLLYTSDAADE